MPRKPGATPSLTRDEIVAKALELADEVGIENVSMRRLAAALGKSPMALYTFFPSSREICEQVLARAFLEVDTDPIPDERWDDTVRRTTSSIRAMYLRHARAHLGSVETTAYSTGLEEHTAKVYRLHEEQGIPADILRKAWRIIDAFLGGFIAAKLAELQRCTELPDPDGRSWVATAEGAYSQEAFDDGIEIIIAGIRGLAAPDPCKWRTPNGVGVLEGDGKTSPRHPPHTII